MSKQYIFQTDWFSSTQHEWLDSLKHLKNYPQVSALEIGSFEGRSAIWLLENILTHPSAHITCVDTWKGSAEHSQTDIDFNTVEQHFDMNISRSGFAHKITKIKMASHIALKMFPIDSFDFIYIDGSHKASDVLEDAVLSWRLLKEGGIMIFDDYIWEPQYSDIESPKIAVDSFVKCFADQISQTKYTQQATMVKK